MSTTTENEKRVEEAYLQWRHSKGRDFMVGDLLAFEAGYEAGNEFGFQSGLDAGFDAGYDSGIAMSY